MKTTSIVRVGALLLTLMMLFVACSGGAKQPPAATADTTPAQKTAAAGDDAPDSDMEGNMYIRGLPILKEKETFKVAWPIGSYSNNAAAEKQAVIDAEQATNIKLEWMEIENTGWTEKVNIMLASQDMPDAFFAGIGDALGKNLEAFHDVTQLIDAYAPSLVAAMEKYPVISAYLTQADGTMRALPTGQMLKKDETTSTIYWINQAWLDAVGMDMPDTTDALYDVLLAFRDQDPNGNGQKDEVPLAFVNQDWAGKFSSLLGPFGVLDPDNHVLVENGKVVFQPTKENLYTALTYFHKLQAEGLMDPESFSQTTAQSVAKMNQNIHGIIACYDPLNKIGPGHTFVPLAPIKGPQGTAMYEGSNEPRITQGMIITVACKNPAALVRFYEYVNAELERKLTWNYGPEDLLWTLKEDGTWNQIEDSLGEGEVWDRIRYTAGFGPNCPSLFTPDECERIQDRFVQARLDAVDALKGYYPAQPYHAVADSAQIASEKNLIKTEIDAYVANFIASSIMEGIDDAKWQKHLSVCESLNIVRYEEIMQQSYDAFNNLMQ